MIEKIILFVGLTLIAYAAVAWAEDHAKPGRLPCRKPIHRD